MVLRVVLHFCTPSAEERAVSGSLETSISWNIAALDSSNRGEKMRITSGNVECEYDSFQMFGMVEWCHEEEDGRILGAWDPGLDHD